MNATGWFPPDHIRQLIISRTHVSCRRTEEHVLNGRSVYPHLKANPQAMLNPLTCTENMIRSFLRYQLTASPLADSRLHEQMRRLLSLEHTRQTTSLMGPHISLSRVFNPGARVDAMIRNGVIPVTPHHRERNPGPLRLFPQTQTRGAFLIRLGKSTGFVYINLKKGLIK